MLPWLPSSYVRDRHEYTCVRHPLLACIDSVALAQRKAANREGRRKLRAAVAQHCSWDPRDPQVMRMRYAEHVIVADT